MLLLCPCGLCFTHLKDQVRAHCCFSRQERVHLCVILFLSLWSQSVEVSVSKVAQEATVMNQRHVYQGSLMSEGSEGWPVRSDPTDKLL